jgi:hypothetical protein
VEQTLRTRRTETWVWHFERGTERVKDIVNKGGAGGEVFFHERSEAREFSIREPDVGLCGIVFVSGLKGFFVV